MPTHHSVISDFRRYAAAMPEDAEWIMALIQHLRQQDEMAQKTKARQQAVPPESTQPSLKGVVYEPGYDRRRPWRAFIKLDGRCRTIGVYLYADDAARSHDRMCWELTHDVSLLNFPEDYAPRDREDNDRTGRT